jgi:hypothetical protein
MSDSQVNPQGIFRAALLQNGLSYPHPGYVDLTKRIDHPECLYRSLASVLDSLSTQELTIVGSIRKHNSPPAPLQTQLQELRTLLNKHNKSFTVAFYDVVSEDVYLPVEIPTWDLDVLVGKVLSGKATSLAEQIEPFTGLNTGMLFVLQNAKYGGKLLDQIDNAYTVRMLYNSDLKLPPTVTEFSVLKHKVAQPWICSVFENLKAKPLTEINLE